MVARIFFPITRLRKLLGRPGGLTQDEAVSRAQTNLSRMRGFAMETVAQCVASIGRRILEYWPLAERDVADIQEWLERIRDIAVMYRLNALEHAAQLFSAVLAEHRRTPPSGEMLRIFTYALQRLATEQDLSPGDEAGLLDHLERLASHGRTGREIQVIRKR